MRSSNWPARPTNGRPIRSSSPPGASPTSMMRASGAPSEKTSRVAVAFRPQPSNFSSRSRSSSRLCAPAASDAAERRLRPAPRRPARSARGAAWRPGAARASAVAGAGGAANRSCGVSSIARSTPASTHQRKISAASCAVEAVRSRIREPFGGMSEAARKRRQTRAARRRRRGSLACRFARSKGQSTFATAAVQNSARRSQEAERFLRRTVASLPEGTGMADESELPARESMDFDVVIVGAGPAGLAAAIRLKQLNADISVVVVEKGSEVGAHILSGAVIDPIGLDRLIPDWRTDPDRPLKTEVDQGPLPGARPVGRRRRCPTGRCRKLMSNHGNFIGSLGATTRWLAARAEALGVEIYPGFAATEILFGAEWRGGRRRDRRHGDRPRRQAQGQLHARHGVARQICAARRRRARLADQADRRPLSPRRGPRPAKIRHRPQGNLAGRSRRDSSPASSSTVSAGRWARARAAALSSIITTRDWSPSASSSISITPIRRCRRSTNSSASRPIR